MSRERFSGAAWWDEAGPDYCEFCQHTFYVEVGFYCADCDRPICPVCVVTVHGQEGVTCSECSSERDQR